MPVSQIQQVPTPYLLEVEVLAVASLEAEAVGSIRLPFKREPCTQAEKYAIMEDRKRSNLCILLKF